MPSAVKLSRVQRKGQVTIPLAFREQLGIDEGDFVAFALTDAGILITPQQVLPADQVERMRAARDAIQERLANSDAAIKSSNPRDG